MADFSFVEDVELQKLNAQVLEEPEEFEHWDKLVRAAEAQEGGLSRNSSPPAIQATRDTYDRLLARFPLFFGYWKKYADLEFVVAGTEAAEMVYERGIASIGISVDLWLNYCGFMVETTHDIDVIRVLFERGAESVGLDFLAHPFWDKYLEFEERLDGHDKVFEILKRIIYIPMHQYARYFQRYREMAQNRSILELASAEDLFMMRREVIGENGVSQKSEMVIEQEVRALVDELHLQVFKRTQEETTKRWTFEQEIKRPYYHVTDLDNLQLANWRNYLDFEEAEGIYARTKFLYERCLVTAANYDEFWIRYARWMRRQSTPEDMQTSINGKILEGVSSSTERQSKQEEVRNIYSRGSCFYVPISRPAIRLYWAQYEESIDQPVIAADIHDSILQTLPDHLETIVSLANLRRRQEGVDAAIAVLRVYLDSPDTTPPTRGALVAEWARLLSDINGDHSAARQIYASNEHLYPDSRAFWLGRYFFEVKHGQFYHVAEVYTAIHTRTQLEDRTKREVRRFYLVYLKERVPGGGAMGNVMARAMQVDMGETVDLANENGHVVSEDFAMAEAGLR
ncbi:hypothetical protein LTR08_008180 [Meristemomyces frigidus]|nr:hypothetical protein LTR08_008180 [Meristemomyces frigidus]